MSRLSTFFKRLLHALTVLLALVAVGLALARFAQPSLLMSADKGQAIDIAAGTAMLRRIQPSALQPLGQLFVSSHGHDPEDGTLRGLRSAFPALDLQPLSKRSNAIDQCELSKSGWLFGPCQEDNFIRIDFLTAPLWRTAIVRATTAGCTYELTLVHLDEWRAMSEKWICA